MSILTTEIGNLPTADRKESATSRHTVAYHGVMEDVVSLIFLFYYFDIQDKAVISINTHAEIPHYPLSHPRVCNISDVANIQIHELEKDIIPKTTLRYGIDLTELIKPPAAFYDSGEVVLQNTRMTRRSDVAYGRTVIKKACIDYFSTVELLLLTKYDINIVDMFSSSPFPPRRVGCVTDCVACGVYKYDKPQEIKNSFEDIEYE